MVEIPINLNVLIVEDSENDALLLQLELERAGFIPVCHRIDKEAALRAALSSEKWDLVIADYVMPEFTGLAALAIVKEFGMDFPFIIVSGHITDDTAVAAMKAGAHDYVMKDNLARLGPAVRRELKETIVRRERRRAEERLHVEHAFRRAIENSVPSGIAVVDLAGRQSYVNPAFCQMVGWTDSELVGAKPPFVYWPPSEVDHIASELSRALESKTPGGIELTFRKRSLERIHVLLLVTPLRDAYGNVTGWVWSVSDITERKQAEIRLAAEHAITRILANAGSLEEAAPGIMQVLLDSLEVDIGTLWLHDPRHDVLHHFHSTLRTMSPELRLFLDATRRLQFPGGEGLPGRVWKTRQTEWWTDAAADSGFERRDLAEKCGLHSLGAFPVQTSERFFGVLEFLTERVTEPDQRLFNMMVAIGSEIGQFIQRRAAEDALRQAHNELELRVQQRTAELKATNTKLQTAIAERKRLENELLEITEKERRRIALDLHDDLGQKLSGIALMTKGLELKLSKIASPATKDAARIHELVQEAMSHASDLAHDLASLALAEKQLPDALDHLAAHARDLFKIQVQLSVSGDIPPLEPQTVHQLYKIAQEALTNAIKHGKARKVSISLSASEDVLRLQVENTGLPFPDLKGHATGMGLRIMNYRTSLLGGTLEVGPNGAKGTLVSCMVPLSKST